MRVDLSAADRRRLRLTKLSLRDYIRHSRPAWTSSSCGGRGVCGTCLVEVDGMRRLACQTDWRDLNG